MCPNDDILLSPSELNKTGEIIKDKLAFDPQDRLFRSYLMYLTNSQK